MKKILIFRSSNFNVINNLNGYINKKYSGNCEIHMIVQNEAYDVVKNEYPNFEFILTDNGFFSYEKYIKNKKLKESIGKTKYDVIYIPLSTAGKGSNREINLIASDIGARHILLFDCLGDICKINNSKLYIVIKDNIHNMLEYLNDFFMIILFYLIYLLCIICATIYWKGKKKC